MVVDGAPLVMTMFCRGASPPTGIGRPTGLGKRETTRDLYGSTTLFDGEYMGLDPGEETPLTNGSWSYGQRTTLSFLPGSEMTDESDSDE